MHDFPSQSVDFFPIFQILLFKSTPPYFFFALLLHCIFNSFLLSSQPTNIPHFSLDLPQRAPNAALCLLFAS